MLKSIDYYATIINDYDNKDLISCNYNHNQHSINMYCYLKDLYNSLKSEFDIFKDHIETLNYIERRLSDAQSEMNFRNHIPIAA
jgi:hypothetical protein